MKIIILIVIEFVDSHLKAKGKFCNFNGRCVH